VQLPGRSSTSPIGAGSWRGSFQRTCAAWKLFEVRDWFKKRLEGRRICPRRSPSNLVRRPWEKSSLSSESTSASGLLHRHLGVRKDICG